MLMFYNFIIVNNNIVIFNLKVINGLQFNILVDAKSTFIQFIVVN